MIRRDAERTIAGLARKYPVVAVTGPRQSGKTTLARAVFPKKPYVSLEDPDQLEFAMDDPRAFLARYGDGAVLDEVQRCPPLFSYIQSRVDEDGRPGLYILTGSQQFGLLAGITQTLAGRVALVHLLPFTLGEIKKGQYAPRSVERLLWSGFYPPIHDRALDPGNWAANYIQTYVERDVRQMINVRNLSAFQKFIRMCAARTGQLTNLSSLANDSGITHNTAREWLSVLEASYIVFFLQPYHRNLRKRLIKTPKLYFYDTGLAAWLLRIRDHAQLSTHSMRGALFETWVVSEFIKGRYNRGLTADFFFWRDRTGNEIDLLCEEGEKLIPIEIKSGQTITRDSFSSLQKWADGVGRLSGQPCLVYAGKAAEVRSGVRVIPWQDVPEFARFC